MTAADRSVCRQRPRSPERHAARPRMDLDHRQSRSRAGNRHRRYFHRNDDLRCAHFPSFAHGRSGRDQRPSASGRKSGPSRPRGEPALFRGGCHPHDLPAFGAFTAGSIYATRCLPMCSARSPSRRTCSATAGFMRSPPSVACPTEILRRARTEVRTELCQHFRQIRVAGLAWSATTSASSVFVIGGKPVSLMILCSGRIATSGRMLTPSPTETAAWMPGRFGPCRRCARCGRRLRSRGSAGCDRGTLARPRRAVWDCA